MTLELVETNTIASTRTGERPGQILQAAIELFRDLGFEKTRLEDVADRAGVSKATIYLYFESKEDLFFALIREKVVPLVQQTIRESEKYQDKPAEFMRHKIEWLGHLMAFGDQGIVLKLMVSEARNFEEIREYYLDNVVRPGIANVTKMIQFGIDSGQFRPCNAKGAAAAFMYPILMSGVWNNSIGPDAAMDVKAALEFHAENFLSGISA